MIIEYFGWTEKGPVRSINEDSILCNRTIYTNIDTGGTIDVCNMSISGNPSVFAIADGMGGHEGGEIASKATLSLMKDNYVKINTTDGLEQKLYNLILKIHYDVNKFGEESDRSDMGTTLVGCLIYKNRFIVFNVGDSRFYTMKNKVFQQVTSDHSLRAETGRIDLPKNLITSCIGGGIKFIKIDLFDLTGQFKTGDYFFICSDGVVDYLSDENISKIILSNNNSVKDSVLKIIEEAIGKGSRDNLSCIVGKICKI